MENRLGPVKNFSLPALLGDERELVFRIRLFLGNLPL